MKYSRVTISNMFSLFASLLVCTLAPSVASAGIITTGAVIPDPVVLDFESAPLGNISSGNSLFSNFGITDIGRQNSSDFNDDYGSRTNSSRALWEDASGLKIVGPGALNNSHDADFWFVDFATTHNYFGYSDHDHFASATIIVTFFNAASNVGAATFPHGGSSDLTTFSFHNTDAFDRIQITSTTNLGLALDNLTLSGVPEPSTFSMLAFGCIAMAGLQRKTWHRFFERRNGRASVNGSFEHSHCGDPVSGAVRFHRWSDKPDYVQLNSKTTHLARSQS